MENSFFTDANYQPRIMIIDDNAANIAFLERILSAHGYVNVRSISDSRQVLDAYKVWQPDIILLDMLMPHLDGLGVLELISGIKSRSYLPVIMITADNDEDNRIKALKMGANDYIDKPFNAQELIARIENLVRLKISMDKAMATETAFLQAQIKPHFLYNTLNTISYFCDTDPAKASRLIDQFATYLRQSFDFKSLKFFVPISRELQLVNSYMEIQKARFGDRISFTLNYDGTDFKLPPLCIQPLVENALRHNLNARQHVSVYVNIARVNEGVSISVRDDGRGIPEEKLAEVLSRSEDKGIGLCNIDTRLKKFYGRGLCVSSGSGRGTEISFIIPMEEAYGDSGNN